LPARAWLVIVGSATTAMAGLSIFVVSGSWLDDAFGVSTGGLGTIAMTFGAVELLASSGTAAFADRLGKLRSTVAGLGALGAGLAVIVAGDRLVVGVIGLLLFLLGFEFAFVTSLSLVSEAVPHARGRTLATANAVAAAAAAPAAEEAVEEKKPARRGRAAASGDKPAARSRTAKKDETKPAKDDAKPAARRTRKT